MASDFFVSIIVPVYNSGLYLEDCLQSIIDQTHSLLEIILINDGSTDNSSEIMNSYARKDKRIVIVSQSNKGVSAARNAGLTVAKGDYVLFVDSDDTIRNDAVEKLCKQAVETGADIVIGNVYFCFQDGKQIRYFKNITEFSQQPLISGEQCFSQLTRKFIFPPLVYLYFSKRSFLQKRRLFFEEGIVHEDELWCVKTLIFAKHVSVMDFYHYYYYERNGSIMHSNNKAYRVRSFFEVAKALESLASELFDKQKFVETIGYIHVRIFYIYYSICALLKEMQEKTNEYKPYFEALLKKVYPLLSGFQKQACLYFLKNGNRLLNMREEELLLMLGINERVTCV